MKVLIAVFFMFSILVCSAGAQGTKITGINPSEVKSLNSAQWRATLDDAKADVKGLLEENEKLNSEYVSLKEKHANLKDILNQLNAEIKDQEQENARLKKRRQEQLRNMDFLYAQTGASRKEIEVHKAKRNELKKQLDNIEEKNRLWQLKVNDMEMQRRDLLLDLKLQEISRQEIREVSDDEIVELKERLRKSKREEEKLSGKAAALRGQSGVLPKEITDIESENKALELQIVQVKKKRDKKLRANKLLRRESERLKNTANKVPARLLKEKRSLEVEVVKLERRLSKVRESVSKSKSILQKKRQLMDEIMSLDSENQKLRNSIADFMKEITSIKAEISDIEGE